MSKDYRLVKIPDGTGGGWLEAWADGRAMATLYVQPDETDIEAIACALDELTEDPVISWDFTDDKAYRETVEGIRWMLTQRDGLLRYKSFA